MNEALRALARAHRAGADRSRCRRPRAARSCQSRPGDAPGASRRRRGRVTAAVLGEGAERAALARMRLVGDPRCRRARGRRARHRPRRDRAARRREALRTSLEELRRSEERLRRLARHQASIREDERKRLGFDLHDDVCQELVGIGILVESLRRRLEEETPSLAPISGASDATSARSASTSGSWRAISGRCCSATSVSRRACIRWRRA